MLFLIFQLGDDRYALDTAQVVEVLPRVGAKEIPQAHPGVAGVFNYHGTPVPLIDLAALSLGHSSQRLLSTRIIVVKYREANLLGLIVEKSTGTIRRDESDFAESGVAADGAPYLGPVTKDERGLIQRIEIGQLLSDEVRDLLFREPVNA